MIRCVLISVFILFAACAEAQNINKHLRQANSLYKQKKFDEALPEYQKSVAEGATDPITNYNLGNALFRTTRFQEAATTFERTAASSPDAQLKQRSYYNQGVSFSKQQKLQESIDAYKKAVLLNPNDQDARVNLQKALMELKKKQPPQEKKENDKKQQQNKDQKKEKQKSNLTKKQVEQLLRALQQREQQVQQKMQQARNRTAGQQEKDW